MTPKGGYHESDKLLQNNGGGTHALFFIAKCLIALMQKRKHYYQVGVAGRKGIES
jgi:hypothetical protein